MASFNSRHGQARSLGLKNKGEHMHKKVKLALIAPVTAAALFGATDTAQASPLNAAQAKSGCTNWTSNSGLTGNVKCTDGSATSTHRAVVTCVSGTGAKFKVTGNWASRGRTSSATCSGGGSAGVYSISHERSHHG
ncbi:hypothetical protein ABZV77_01330 [Streptomyces sp. NPDC004732]|uniref:hypothetical protein n=1 Tax=Streptomyces sp. NPDC004732 TaxID=3154290 RepID=UPI0033B4DE25